MELAARAAPDGYTMVLPAIAYARESDDLTRKCRTRSSSFTAGEHRRQRSARARGDSQRRHQFGQGSHRSGESEARTIAILRRAGNGSSLHLAGELFKYMAGVDLLHIPYKGTNDFIPDLLSGRVPTVHSRVRSSCSRT
jgi:hypothetical protein